MIDEVRNPKLVFAQLVKNSLSLANLEHIQTGLLLQPWHDACAHLFV